MSLPIDALPFDSLSWFIQKKISEKMQYKDFLAFQLASKLALTTANRVKSRFLLPNEMSEVIFDGSKDEPSCRIWPNIGTKPMRFTFSEAPLIRFEADDTSVLTPLHDVFCQRLVDFFLCSGSTTSNLRIFETEGTIMDASPASLRCLLKIAKVKALCILNGAISLDAFRCIPKTVTKINCIAPLTDSDLLSTKAKTITFERTLITNDGINAFLKEWKEGKREFEFLSVTSTADIFRSYESLKDLDYVVTECDEFYTQFVVRHGSQFLKVFMGNQEGKHYIGIYDKEYFPKTESDYDSMDYEEDWEEEEDEYHEDDDHHHEEEADEMEF